MKCMFDVIAPWQSNYLIFICKEGTDIRLLVCNYNKQISEFYLLRKEENIQERWVFPTIVLPLTVSDD